MRAPDDEERAWERRLFFMNLRDDVGLRELVFEVAAYKETVGEDGSVLEAGVA